MGFNTQTVVRLWRCCSNHIIEHIVNGCPKNNNGIIHFLAGCKNILNNQYPITISFFNVVKISPITYLRGGYRFRVLQFWFWSSSSYGTHSSNQQGQSRGKVDMCLYNFFISLVIVGKIYTNISIKKSKIQVIMCTSLNIVFSLFLRSTFIYRPTHTKISTCNDHKSQ